MPLTAKLYHAQTHSTFLVFLVPDHRQRKTQNVTPASPVRIREMNSLRSIALLSLLAMSISGVTGPATATLVDPTRNATALGSGEAALLTDHESELRSIMLDPALFPSTFSDDAASVIQAAHLEGDREQGRLLEAYDSRGSSSDPGTSAVPEASTLSLFGLGLLAASSVWKRVRVARA